MDLRAVQKRLSRLESRLDKFISDMNDFIKVILWEEQIFDYQQGAEALFKLHSKKVLPALNDWVHDKHSVFIETSRWAKSRLSIGYTIR